MWSRERLTNRIVDIKFRGTFLSDADMGILVAQNSCATAAECGKRERIGRCPARRWQNPDFRPEDGAYQVVQTRGDRIGAVGCRRAIIRARDRRHNIGVNRGDVVAVKITAGQLRAPKPRRTAPTIASVWNAWAARG